MGFLKIVGFGLLGLVVVLALMIWGGSKIPPQESTATARDAVKAGLKDPGSAQFDDVRVYRAMSDDPAGKSHVCGSVNAKNSFGGYAGPRRFIFDGNYARLQEDDGDVGFVKDWQRYCSFPK